MKVHVKELNDENESRRLQIESLQGRISELESAASRDAAQRAEIDILRVQLNSIQEELKRVEESSRVITEAAGELSALEYPFRIKPEAKSLLTDGLNSKILPRLTKNPYIRLSDATVGWDCVTVVIEDLRPQTPVMLERNFFPLRRLQSDAEVAAQILGEIDAWLDSSRFASPRLASEDADG